MPRRRNVLRSSMPKFRLRTAVLVVALVAVACGGNAGESGVNVKTVATDLTYGIPETPKPARPANTGPETTEPRGVVKEGLGEPSKDIPPVGPPPNPCPVAPPDLFPPAAPSEFAGSPAAGDYTWRHKGTQTVPNLGKLNLPTFGRRTVLNVGTVNGGPKFTVEERELVYGSQFTIRTTYEFRKGGIDENVQGNNVDRTGLYITKIERMHRGDPNASSEFNPSPPVVVLTSPVVLGDPVNSVGVDPVSFEVLRQNGRVTKRVRVDACGKPQDAFWVETFQDFVAADGTTTRRQFNYGIATVMGGLPIVEHIEAPCVDTDGVCQKDAVSFTLDAHIGQLEPSKPAEPNKK
jgi:hypothetical protein